MRGWLLVDLPCLAAGLLAWPWTGPWGLAAAAGAAACTHTACVCNPRCSLYLPVHWRVRTAESELALTFDDGPDPEATPAILDALGEAGMQATFFVIGAHAAEHPALLRRMWDEGHAVGVHTQWHPRSFPLLRPARMRTEVEACRRQVAAATGVEPRLFRPPMGLTTPLVGLGLARSGLALVTWGLHAADNRLGDGEAIRRRLAPRWRSGVVAVFHDGSEPGRRRDRAPTVRALRGVLADLLGRGLTSRALGLREGRLVCVAGGETTGGRA